MGLTETLPPVTLGTEIGLVLSLELLPLEGLEPPVFEPPILLLPPLPLKVHCAYTVVSCVNTVSVVIRVPPVGAVYQPVKV